MKLAAGATIGAYEVVSPIGAGGMGEVYRARDTRLRRDVALKVLPQAFAADEQRLSRFKREAEVLASLNHPNIGAIYGIEDADAATTALVLELVEGQTLADRLARGPLTIGQALDFARQLADALGAAHERGIVHRDLKPANVVITASGIVKVLDFGLAVAPESHTDAAAATTMAATMPGTIVGTPSYMSPEQAAGGSSDRSADVWAFGCVVYEMLTGRRTFPGSTVSEILGNVLGAEPTIGLFPTSHRRASVGCSRDVFRKIRTGAFATSATRDSRLTTRWRGSHRLLPVQRTIDRCVASGMRGRRRWQWPS